MQFPLKMIATNLRGSTFEQTPSEQFCIALMDDKNSKLLQSKEQNSTGRCEERLNSNVTELCWWERSGTTLQREFRVGSDCSVKTCLKIPRDPLNLSPYL